MLGAGHNDFVPLHSDGAFEAQGSDQACNRGTVRNFTLFAIYSELHRAREHSRGAKNCEGGPARAKFLAVASSSRARLSLLGFGLAVFGGVSIALAGGMWAAIHTVRTASVTVELAGSEYSLAADGSNIPAVAEAAERRFERDGLYLRVDDETLEVPRSELGQRVDRARLTEELGKTLSSLAGLPSSPALTLTRAFALWGPEPGGHLEARVQLPLELDREQARTTLTRLAQAVYRPPEDAELLIREHRIIPSRPGRDLSVSASLLRLENLEPGEDWLELDVIEIPPDVTEDQLSPVDVTRVLSSYETSFRGKAGARAVNIRTAARYLNGAVILPGEILSFNARVGRRVHGRGFVDAPVIVNDEMDEDVGGGVCQVATTLHAAAIFGNLEIVERRSHSRPSGYAPLGLDATVIDGKVDLRIRNPYDEPLLVHAYVTDPFLVRVELLGRLPDVEIEHAYSVTAREAFSRRVWHKAEVAPFSFEKKQKGSEGMDVVSVVRARKGDREVSRRTYFSKYYPVPEVFYVGSGFLAQNLPPMPEGAVGLVIDGDAIGPVSQNSAERTPTIDESNGITPDSTAGALLRQ